MTRWLCISSAQAKTLTGMVLLALMLGGCEQRTEKSAPTPASESPAPAPGARAAPALDTRTVGVWLHGIGVLDASLSEARQLGTAIESFLKEPDEDSLSQARRAWHRSHNAYLEFELFSALSAASPDLFGSLVEHDFAIDAWPIQPGYLDYFDVYSRSGIVNDLAVPLTADALREQHGLTDSSDVSLGFHALEYLLWGENGKRPAGDYSRAELTGDLEAAGLRPVDLPRNRRRVLVELLANLLIDDLASLKQAMENPNGLLRRGYTALPAGERLEVLRTAGQVLLSHHRDLLQAQLDSLENEDPEARDLSESLYHSPFAGGQASNLAHSLQTVETVLLQNDVGVAKWLLEGSEHPGSAREKLAELNSGLLSREDESWPPQGEQGRDVVNSLATVAELLAE